MSNKNVIRATRTGGISATLQISEDCVYCDMSRNHYAGKVNLNSIAAVVRDACGTILDLAGGSASFGDRLTTGLKMAEESNGDFLRRSKHNPQLIF